MQFGLGMGMMMNTPEMRDWYGEFAQIQRLPDVEVDGAPQAVFETSVDLGKMLMSQEFRDIVRQLLEQSAAAGGEELDQRGDRPGAPGRADAGEPARARPRLRIHPNDRSGHAVHHCKRCANDRDLSGVIQLLAMVGELPGPEWRGAEPAFEFTVRSTSGDFNAAPAGAARRRLYDPAGRHGSWRRRSSARRSRQLAHSKHPIRSAPDTSPHAERAGTR